MKVLVDTCVWSLALRRDKSKTIADPVVMELHELIEELRVQMVGPIRQEILSGIRSQAQFNALRERLRMFPDLEMVNEDYERAAEMFNMMRSRGIQGSNTDFLLCAISESRKIPIFTTDADFKLFRRHFHIKLHVSRPTEALRTDRKDVKHESGG